jgi:hypothetical protein
VLAYTSLAVLFSVVTRSGIVGVLGPILVALLTQLLALIGKGVIVHMLLIGTGFDAWHGLFVPRPFFGPLVVSLLISAAWVAGSLAAAWAILRRREFVASTSARRGSWTIPARITGGAVLLVAWHSPRAGARPASPPTV